MDPQWSPDGKAIAFVSDRNGVANIYLYEIGEGEVYQLTDFYTGVQGITALSPVLSWAHSADKLAFVYFEQAKYDIYTLTNPRSLKKQPWRPDRTVAQRPMAILAPTGEAARPAVAAIKPPSGPQILGGGAIYRTPRGFRRADSLPPQSDSARAAGVGEPISIAKILDSIPFTPPDTSEFTFKPYKATLEPEYVTRPTIGYTRNTFGNGFTGSTGIVLGDMLGNHQLGFAASLNGRINETLFLAQYVNLSRRLNWALGVAQEPYFYYEGSGYQNGPNTGEVSYVQSIRRLVVRDVEALGSYPFSRFRRLEFGAGVFNVQDARRLYYQPFDPNTGLATSDPFTVDSTLQSASFVQPSLALVFDNTIFGPVGPILGRRERFEVSQRVGDWRFTTLNFDYRRYDRFLGPFTLATRFQYYGQHGRDEERFRFFAGSPDLLRGYTVGSFAKHECLTAADSASTTGCLALDQLVGTRLGIATIELRFPLLGYGSGLLSTGFPAIEGAFFYDAGVAWQERKMVQFSRHPGQPYDKIRVPLTSTGLALRANLFNFLILRADYAFPLQRPGVNGYWTISLGPTF